MEMLDKALSAISEGNFTELEDTWTEMILAHDTENANFFEICDALKKAGLPERARSLLEMLAEQYETEKAYDNALKVRKKMVYFSDRDETLRIRIIDLYKKLYRNSTHLDEYLDISGLNNNTPILKAMTKLDEFLKYDVGRYFYFERYGFGEIIDTIPQKKEVIIDFEKKKKHFLSISVAQGLLIPVVENSFLHCKYNDIEKLKEMSQKHPEELIKMIIKDSSESLSASQIKAHLDGIIEKKQLGKWWEKQRKKIEKDKYIKVSGRTTKQYTYIKPDQDKTIMELAAFNEASAIEKYFLAETYAKKEPALFDKVIPELVHMANRMYKKEPGLALDILMLCQDHSKEANFAFSKESIIDEKGLEYILKTLQNTTHQKSILILARQREQEWVRIFKNLMFTSDNPKLLDELAKNLEIAPDTLKDIYYTVFSFPKKYPAQYQWMLKAIAAGNLTEFSSPSFIPRLISSLEYIKGIKGTVLKILNLNDFDKTIAGTTTDEAQRILEAINTSNVLPDYVKKDFTRIIAFHHPNLFTREVDIIYTTEKALKKKQNELDHLLKIDIPENKKEISRAREYGDLSENFEYKAARERQEQLYSKVRTIENELSKIQIIKSEQISTDCVSIGSKVILKNINNNKPSDYTILGRWDTDLEKNVISNEAPVAKLLLNKIPGDQVIINEDSYEVVKIEKAVL